MFRRSSGKKGFYLTLSSHSITEVRTDAEAVKGCCLLACSSWLVQCAFLNNSGPLSPGVAPPMVSWALPLLVLNQNAPSGQSYGGISSVKNPQTCLRLCQVDNGTMCKDLEISNRLFIDDLEQYPRNTEGGRSQALSGLAWCASSWLVPSHKQCVFCLNSYLVMSLDVSGGSHRAWR